jgi:hypothetical protein
MSLARLAIAGLVLAPALGARAGVLIEGVGGETPHRILMDGPRVRIETVGSHALVFDGGAKRSLQLDLANKTYSELTKDDLAQITAMRRQTDAAAPAPPKSRATRFEKTGRTEQALGRRCDVYRVVESDGTRSDEMCVAPFGSFGVERADLGGFRALEEFAHRLSGGDLHKDWADLPGVPLISWELEDGAPRETFRATKVEKRAIPASEFAAPPGWKRNPGLAEQMKKGMK